MERQDVFWEGDSKQVIRSFSEDAKENLGNDLGRLQDGLQALDSAPMGSALRGVFELRDEDKDFWYRVLYTRIEGAIYVLHCFRKKTNQTSPRDTNLAEQRLKKLKQCLVAEKKGRK